MRELQHNTTRYEQIMREHSTHSGDTADLLYNASRHACATVTATIEHDQVIRDVAAGVAAPALLSAVVWMLHEAQHRNLDRLRFLSRDGQVLYELARRLGPTLAPKLDLEYIYSSRLTWSLAATDPNHLDDTSWLFNSFMKSNALDLCTRLGLPMEDYIETLLTAGVSLNPDSRADRTEQAEAMRRFLRTDEIKSTASQRITETRHLLIEYARQHSLADSRTGLVDAGWTGRMIGSLVTVCEEAGFERPHVLFWGHEPRPTGWTDPDRVAAYMYNTATHQGTHWRVPDAPFVVETFCMGDHGIVSGYQRAPAGHVEPILQSHNNRPAEDWGLNIYRSTLYAFADAVTDLTDNPRPLIHELMNTFWCHPTAAEAAAWGAYPYDSDPAGTAVRPLARALSVQGPDRGDRAWLAGSLALSSDSARGRYLSSAPPAEITGAPASD
ncbi:hypothetical protein [Nocardia miyunensis]|uniref:hypothetical protein n=1 Tax=Nocardia miyunensis TaxID=282684 RepID=UPI000AC5D0A7|nr:hypothetical protein [Nocardia miyunensis]